MVLSAGPGSRSNLPFPVSRRQLAFPPLFSIFFLTFIPKEAGTGMIREDWGVGNKSWQTDRSFSKQICCITPIKTLVRGTSNKISWHYVGTLTWQTTATSLLLSLLSLPTSTSCSQCHLVLTCSPSSRSHVVCSTPPVLSNALLTIAFLPFPLIKNNSQLLTLN